MNSNKKLAINRTKWKELGNVSTSSSAYKQDEEENEKKKKTSPVVKLLIP